MKIKRNEIATVEEAMKKDLNLFKEELKKTKKEEFLEENKILIKDLKKAIKSYNESSEKINTFYYKYTNLINESSQNWIIETLFNKTLKTKSIPENFKEVLKKYYLDNNYEYNYEEDLQYFKDLIYKDEKN